VYYVLGLPYYYAITATKLGTRGEADKKICRERYHLQWSTKRWKLLVVNPAISAWTISNQLTWWSSCAVILTMWLTRIVCAHGLKLRRVARCAGKKSDDSYFRLKRYRVDCDNNISVSFQWMVLFVLAHQVTDLGPQHWAFLQKLARRWGCMSISLYSRRLDWPTLLDTSVAGWKLDPLRFHHRKLLNLIGLQDSISMLLQVE
jgi:hypothetical protein